ncbi:MAG: hypothetical protein ACTSRK_08095 [Promethearchaeota archaeon]
MPLIISFFKKFYRNHDAPTGIYLLFLIILLISNILYSLNGYISKENNFIGIISQSGSVIGLIMANIIFAYYFYYLNGRYSIWTTMYVAETACTIIALFFDPWELIYFENIGYVQTFSNLFLLLISVNLLLLAMIVGITLGRMIKFVNRKLNEEDISKEEFSLLKKKKWGYIFLLFSYIIGLLIGTIGMMPGVYYLDFFAQIIIFIPQTIYIALDKNALFTQNTNLRGSVLIINNLTGSTICSWKPEKFKEDNVQIAGFMHAIRIFSKVTFNTNVSSQFIGSRNLYLINYSLEKCSIIVPITHISPYIENVTIKTLKTFNIRYSDNLKDFKGLDIISNFESFKSELEKNFRIFE